MRPVVSLASCNAIIDLTAFSQPSMNEDADELSCHGNATETVCTLSYLFSCVCVCARREITLHAVLTPSPGLSRRSNRQYRYNQAVVFY